MPVVVDSFEDQSLDNWIDAFSVGWGTDTGQAYDGSVSAYLSTDINSATGALLYSTSGLSGYPTTGETAHIRVYIGTGADNAEVMFAWGVQDDSNYYYGLKTEQGGLELHKVVGGTDTILNDVSGSGMIAGEFLELEVSAWDGSGNMTFTVYEADGTEDLSVSGQDTNANYTSGGIGFGVGEGGPSGAEFWVDDVVNESASGGSTTTPYLGLTLPEKGREDWHIPLNENFGLIENEVTSLANELGVSKVGGYAQPSKGTTDWDTILNDNLGLIESDVSDLANALSDPPTVGGYAQPAEGTTDWHLPLNDNFTKIDDDLAAIDADAGGGSGSFQVTGEQRVWHRVGVILDGPTVSEGDATNPFTDYRMDVTFTGPSGQQYVVPGHFAADGDAAETSASSGSKWRAYLMPEESGTWDFAVSFTTGADVAIDGGGTATGPDGTTGSFTVEATDKATPDFRAKGLLEHTGEHYLIHAGNGETFIKNGPGSPENFLGYYEFDQTEDLGGLSPETPSGLHEYVPHEGDFNSGDPTWQGGKGQGIIGLVNYIASKNLNSQYMIIYTTDGGDGEDVWPWTGPNTKDRYDVSKLDQWEIVFEHMTSKGIQPHILFREQENDDVMDGGDLGRLNALYYREIVSRFAHHPAIKWNLGEESDLIDAQLKDHAAELRSLDPYDHPIGFHTYAGEKDRYDNLYGDPNFDITSYQGPGRGIRINSWPIYAREQSAAAGDPWVVEVDEQYNAPVGVPPDGETIDGVTQEDFRKGMLWEMYLGGGSGEEWYCGFYQNQNDTDSTADDLRCEDHRERDNWWTWGSYALDFVRTLPVRDMAPDNSLVSGGFALADPGTIYAIYTTDGTIDIDLPSGDWTVEWFDPVGGGFVSAESVPGGTGTSLSAPSGLDDAAARLTPA